MDFNLSISGRRNQTADAFYFYFLLLFFFFFYLAATLVETFCRVYFAKEKIFSDSTLYLRVTPMYIHSLELKGVEVKNKSLSL